MTNPRLIPTNTTYGPLSHYVWFSELRTQIKPQALQCVVQNTKLKKKTSSNLYYTLIIHPKAPALDFLNITNLFSMPTYCCFHSLLSIKQILEKNFCFSFVILRMPGLEGTQGAMSRALSLWKGDGNEHIRKEEKLVEDGWKLFKFKKLRELWREKILLVKKNLGEHLSNIQSEILVLAFQRDFKEAGTMAVRALHKEISFGFVGRMWAIALFLWGFK